jgi:hypothetical protein
MGIRLSKIFIVLTGMMLGALMAKEVRATSITFDFTATVTFAQNTSNLTGGVIPVPSVLTGSYTFDSTAVDQFPGDLEGEYIYSSTPNGLIVQAGTNVFQTDPNNVDYLIFVEDGTPVGVNVPDVYDVQSNKNLYPLPLGTQVAADFFQIQMLDTVDFISGDELPLVPPQPTLPPVVQIKAIAANLDIIFWVKANIESITVRPPPTVESTIQDLKNFVTGLPTGSFQNSNMQSTLLNKIDALKGSGNGIKNKLINDILSKGNGCGTAPDSNDWIKDCAAQQQFQAAVQAILALL